MEIETALRIPEFIGGLLVGFSFFAITLGVVFLPRLDGISPPGNVYWDFLLPYGAALVAGIAIGFGLQSDEGGYSFGGDFSEQVPTIIGGISLALALGLCVIYFLNGLPTFGIIIALISIVLAVLGFVITLTSWESAMY